MAPTISPIEDAQQSILVVAPYVPGQSTSKAADSQARMLVHSLIDSTPSSSKDSRIGWTIKNKYYTATVYFDVVALPLVGTLPPKRFENEVHADVRQDHRDASVYLNEVLAFGCPAVLVSLASVPDAASQQLLLDQLELVVDCADVAISLALAPVAPQASKCIGSEQVQDAFLEVGWEYIVLADTAQSDQSFSSSASDHGEEEAKQAPLDRAREALMAHMWPKMVTVSNRGIGPDTLPTRDTPTTLPEDYQGDLLVDGAPGVPDTQPTAHDDAVAQSFLARIQEVEARMVPMLGSEGTLPRVPQEGNWLETQKAHDQSEREARSRQAQETLSRFLGMDINVDDDDCGNDEEENGVDQVDDQPREAEGEQHDPTRAKDSEPEDEEHHVGNEPVDDDQVRIRNREPLRRTSANLPSWLGIDENASEEEQEERPSGYRDDALRYYSRMTDDERRSIHRD